MSARTSAAEPGPRPELSVVVTLYDEVGTLDELQQRLTATLGAFGRPYEIIFVDDGSTDGPADARAAPRGRRARPGRAPQAELRQHPAMHAGLSRARGGIVVTMDGDLQNQPEDIPELVEAVEAGSDVASGRRAARRDSWGRTLPSRLINGMLRRFTGVDISDFGCAFNAYRREAIEPMLGAIGRQKFTKALVLSGGASVVEVDIGHAPREGVALLAAPADAPCAARARRLLAAADPVAGVVLGLLCSLASLALGVYGIVYWIGEDDFPGPLFGGALVARVLGVQGFILALVGEYLGRIQRTWRAARSTSIDREL